MVMKKREGGRERLLGWRRNRRRLWLTLHLHCTQPADSAQTVPFFFSQTHFVCTDSKSNDSNKF